MAAAVFGPEGSALRPTRADFAAADDFSLFRRCSPKIWLDLLGNASNLAPPTRLSPEVSSDPLIMGTAQPVAPAVRTVAPRARGHVLRVLRVSFGLAMTVGNTSDQFSGGEYTLFSNARATRRPGQELRSGLPSMQKQQHSRL